jgi:hypothetical protein
MTTMLRKNVLLFQNRGPSDTTAPTCVITANAATIASAAFTATFTFSEDVINFVVGDITVGNGSAGTFNTVSASVYTAIITPTATGTVTVDVGAGVCTDAALNANTASNTFSILYVAAKLWLKADAGIFTDDAATTPAASDGDVIAVWQDQSGQGYHVSQTDNTKRPLLKLAANGINSRPTILFDGTNDILVRTVANWLSGDSAGSMFAVTRMSATPSSNQLLLATSDEATGATRVVLHYILDVATSGQVLKQYQDNAGGADTVKGNTVLSVNTTYVVKFGSTGTAYNMRVNSVDQTPNVTGGTNSGDWYADVTARDNFSVGGGKWNAEAQFLKGSIAELLVFSTDVTGAALTAVESYLNTRYAAF